MHCAMSPVMPSILNYEEDGDVESHCLPAREWNACVHATVFRHWVEKPDLGELDSEVAEENQLRALPLFSRGWNLLVLDLVLVEIGDSIDDNPRNASTKIHNFMHDEAHYPSREDIILHVLVPTLQWSVSICEVAVRAVDLQPKDARTNSGERCIWTAHCRYRDRYLEPPRLRLTGTTTCWVHAREN